MLGDRIITMTRADGDRIDRLMEEEGIEHDTVGPAHDPFGRESAWFDVKSPLARFLMRKGLLKDGQTMLIIKQRYTVSYEVSCAHVWSSARYSHGMGCKIWSISAVTIG